MVIKSGDVFEFRTDENMSIYIIEPAMKKNVWSVYDRLVGMMYNLDDAYIKEHFAYTHSYDDVYVEQMRRKYNPTLTD